MAAEIKSNVTIYGCGNMGAGLAKKLKTYSNLKLYDHNIAKATDLAQKLAVSASISPREAIEGADVVLLAVKPQDIVSVVADTRSFFDENQILFSIAVATPITALKKAFVKPKVVRGIPNLGCLYGKGVFALSCEERVDSKNKEHIENLIQDTGLTFWSEENNLDAITALSSSGPAFFFVFIESMIEAAVAMGLDTKTAKAISIKTIEGTLETVTTSGLHPAELRWQVASPGGSTIAGLKHLEDESVRSGLINTFLAAFERLKEMQPQ